MSDRILVLQHSALVGMGWLEDAIQADNHGFDLCRLDQGEPLPEGHGYRAIAVLGGTMHAFHEDEFPFLALEKVFLAKAVHDDVPVLGICLGSQLLADALGGRAYLSPDSEGGLLEVPLTEAGRRDPAAREIRGPVAVSHGSTFDLPPGADLLAATASYRHAYRAGSALAVQSHPEAGADAIRTWIELGGENSNIVKAGVDVAELQAEADRIDGQLHDQAMRFFGAWLAEI